MSKAVGYRTIYEKALGAVVTSGGTTFRVWAPKPRKIELVLGTSGAQRAFPMERDGEYWALTVPNVSAGTRYSYRLDGEGPFPDPCSRSQPDGVHDPSEVVDPFAYDWNDGAWNPPDPADLAIYECHIGTLTEKGTFDSAIAQLPRLRRLGVTAVEVMPVASCPGRWNWGYDGVSLFAPSASYGGPDPFRAFVDTAHQAGIAVILDVVYNHFGPDGNYTSLFSERYTTEKHQTLWGAALNFDDADSEHVRRFFAENLLHWVHEYHVDGFRFDATFAIQDSSPKHILAEFADTLASNSRNNRRACMIAETHENDVRYLKPVSEGGFGFDAVWTDDFHHILRTILTGESEGYYGAYGGNIAKLSQVIQQGFYYEGQPDPHEHKPRGTRAREQPWRQFVYCIQNHDQIGNRAMGDRLNATIARRDFLAAEFLLLLLPQTPMVFQGQEFLASTPFMYFTDHNPELGKLVTEGRRREFGAFAAFRDPAVRELIPDPQSPNTFYRSKLRLDEAEFGIGQMSQNLVGQLLRLRYADPVLRETRRARSPLNIVHGDYSLAIEIKGGRSRRVIVANFGEQDEVALSDAGELSVALSTGEPRFGGNSEMPEVDADKVKLPGHSATFLMPNERYELLQRRA